MQLSPFWTLILSICGVQHILSQILQQLLWWKLNYFTQHHYVTLVFNLLVYRHEILRCFQDLCLAHISHCEHAVFWLQDERVPDLSLHWWRYRLNKILEDTQPRFNSIGKIVITLPRSSSNLYTRRVNFQHRWWHISSRLILTSRQNIWRSDEYWNE
jgi:hypothetical protein